MSKYESEFKDKLIRLHLNDGRTLMSLSKEYGVNKATICNWVKMYREECKLTLQRMKKNTILKRTYNLESNSKSLRKKLDSKKRQRHSLQMK